MANIALLLDMAADAAGDRVAVGDRTGGLTFGELRRMARSTAPALAATANGSLAYGDANGVAVPLALFAAAWAGVAYAPLNYRLPAAQQDQLLQRLGSGYHVPHGTAAGWAEEVRATSGEGGDAFPDPCPHPAVLLFTSGTSGEPKSAVLDHEHLLSYIFNTGDFMAAGEEEAVLATVPPFHIAGVSGILSSVYAGRRMVLLEQFGAEVWLEVVRREEITHAFVVPTMLARIVAEVERTGGGELPSLRTLSYGGARMPEPVLEQALACFPNAGFVNAYGLTETSSTVALLGPEDHRLALASEDPVVRRRLSSVGRPVPGIEVGVVDDDGTPVPVGARGRIRLRGPQVSGRYVGLASPVDPDGWLVTGDLGSLDPDGYLFVEGRADDVIIAGGENLSPGEIEDCLMRHPKVTGAVVVGVTDVEWGETVAAMVTCADPVAPEGLAEWVRRDLGGLKSPKRIVVADELPMTDTGKLLRRRVREVLGATVAPDEMAPSS